jgi:hypothetical protein
MLLDPTTHNGYNIMSALRGPDNEDGAAIHVKRITTAVLRWLVGMEAYLSDADPHAYYNGALVASPKSAQEYWDSLLPDTQAKAINFWSSEPHFAKHTTAAFESLNTVDALKHLDWLRTEFGGSL